MLFKNPSRNAPAPGTKNGATRSTLWIATGLAALAAGCGGDSADTVAPVQPVLGAKSKAILSIDKAQFKDLNGDGKLDAYEDWRLPVSQRVDDLVSRMSLQEKIGLMTVNNVFLGGPAGTSCAAGETGLPLVCEARVTYFGLMQSESTSDMVNKLHSRYLVIRENPSAETLAAWTNNVQRVAEGSRLGIPVVLASNPRNHAAAGAGFSEASGVFSYWPGTLGLAAAHDPAMVREFAEIAAKEWRATGIQKGYMYQADLATEPRWTRNNGTFGDDPDLVSDYQTQLVLGFQGKALSASSVSLTTKHFPGNGSAPQGVDSHYADGKYALYPTGNSLINYQLKPFQAAIDAGTSSVMTYYQAPLNAGAATQLPKDYWVSDAQQFEEVGAAFNKKLLDYLRNAMGFKGYINTDSRVMLDEGQPHGVENLAPYQREAKAIAAGSNLISLGSGTLVNGQTTVFANEDILKAVRAGLVQEAAIDASVKLLLKEIFALGLFENPYVDVANASKIVASAEAQAKAKVAQHKSVVMLKNDGVLPLKANVGAAVKLYAEVFKAGATAATQTTALRSLLKTTYPNATLVEDYNDATHALLMLVPNNFTATDTNGKKYEKISLETSTGIDIQKVQAIQATSAKTVIAVNMGNPWLLDAIEPKASGLFAIYDTSTDALLDVVTGAFNPSGKLPMAIPKNIDAVNKNAPDVPGHLESFDYAYKDAQNNSYTFKFGLRYPQ